MVEDRCSDSLTIQEPKQFMHNGVGMPLSQSIPVARSGQSRLDEDCRKYKVGVNRTVEASGVLLAVNDQS